MREVIVNYVFIYLTLLISDGKSAENDAPECKDVKMFLDIIERGLKFTGIINSDDDVGFGLLFVRENLERISRFMKINHRQPLDLLKRISEIRIKVKNQLMQGHFTMIGPLYDKLFIVPLTKDFKYKVSEFEQKPIPTIQEQFLSTRDYMKAVLSVDTSQNSSLNMCLSAMLLRLNSKKHFKKSSCKIDKHCHRFIMYGPNFGYGLTRRLISLMIPNAHQCYLFSPESDQRLIHKICSAIHNEAVYISSNNYLINDLFMEQNSLCSSLGYTHFIKRRWLSKILSLQEENGCFQNPQAKAHFTPKFFQMIGYSDEVSRNKTDTKRHHGEHAVEFKVKMERQCSPHLTSASMAAASVAARYTIESCLDKYRFVQNQVINRYSKEPLFFSNNKPLKVTAVKAVKDEIK